MSNGLIKYAACQRAGFTKTAEMEKEAIAFLPLLLAGLTAGGIGLGAYDTYRGAKKMHETGGKDGKADLGLGLFGMLPGIGWLGKGINYARSVGRLGQGGNALKNFTTGTKLMTDGGRNAIANSNRTTQFTKPFSGPKPTGGWTAPTANRFVANPTTASFDKNWWAGAQNLSNRVGAHMANRGQVTLGNVAANAPTALRRTGQFLGRQIGALNPYRGNYATQNAWRSAQNFNTVVRPWTGSPSEGFDSAPGPIQQTGESDWQNDVNNQSTSGQSIQQNNQQDETPYYDPHSTR